MRYELKYILSPIQYQLLRGRLRWLMQQDEHAGADGDYFIRSVYFDSYHYSALAEKSIGIDQRQKYRIRFYNGDAEVCFLECKKKKGTRIEKESCPLGIQDREELMSGKVRLQEGNLEDLLPRLKALVLTKGFQPVIVVDYLREAYVHPVSNVRITFDKQIAAGSPGEAFESSRFLGNVLQPGYMVLEVKYDEYLPKYIAEAIESIRPVQVAASKYVMCLNEKMEGKIR